MRSWDAIPAKNRSAYKPCPECSGPCARHANFCVDCSPLIRGENHYAWKGDGALETTKRERAQAMYGLGACVRCGKKATDRHHIDGDTGNNAPENIEILCRRCHMEIDGRLARLVEVGTSREPAPPKPCSNCARLYKPLRRGRCHACNEYLRRRGIERPVPGGSHVG